MSENDDMLPVALMNARTRGVYFLVDKHNDHLADFDQELDDHECQRIVDLINANDAALRRAKAEGKLEGMEEAAILVEAMPMATPYNTALSLRWVVKERREADARAAQIEEGE